MMLAIWRITSGNGTPGLGVDILPPFLVAQWSVVRVEGRDVSRQGNVVRSNQSGVPSPSSYIRLYYRQNVPSVSHFRIPSFFFSLSRGILFNSIL